MNNNPPPPPAPAVRFRVVAGSDIVKRSNSPQTSSAPNPPPQQSYRHPQPRIRYIRPMERLNYVRAPPGYHVHRSDMPFSQPMHSVQPRRIIPTIIRQPITRIIRPILNHPQQSGNPDNKNKMIKILQSFLIRCASTPDANLSQMVITTEQYLKGVVSTSEYMQILSQNLKGVKDNLASFLELNIFAVRKDIQEKKIAMEDIVAYKIPKSEVYQNVPSQSVAYSTPSPSLHTVTVSNEQQPKSIKSEPRSVSSTQEQQESQVSLLAYQSPRIAVSSSSYQIAKVEPGSARSSPILRTSSPQYQLINKSHGSVGAIVEHQQIRSSPLTITREAALPPKTSPLAATTAPNMEMQTTMSYQDQQQQLSQEPMETESQYSQEAYIVPEQSQFVQQLPQQFQQLEQPQFESHPQILPDPQHLANSPQPPPQSQSQEVEEYDANIPLTELPHDIAFQRSLIDPVTFSALMQKKVPGITIESPAFLMISEFLETKIRKIISNARLAAEHRSEQFRSNPDFVEVENPRAQLKAMEKLEKAEKQRKIDLENEKLSKGSKNDPNKAKEFAKTIEDETLNRDANEAAMSALGGKKRTWQSRKPDGPDGGPAAKKAAIARAKQISMKDLLFAFEKDSFAKNSIVYRKILYGLYNDSKN